MSFWKRFLFILIGLIVFIFVSGMILRLAYSAYTPADDFDVIQENIDYFRNSYEESRTHFQNEVNARLIQFPGSWIDSIHVPSQTDTDLYIEIGFFSGGSTEKLLIITSGIHGAEGYLGSALQQVFLDQYLSETIENKVDILLIHGINPYGYKYNRRVTENNVDLNRNCVPQNKMFQTKNEGYDQIRDLINPQEPVDLSRGYHRNYVFLAMRMIALHGMEVLRQAILQGQYDHPRSVYFGGFDYEHQILKIGNLIDSISDPYKTLLAIDIHTGYGERGKLHLFPNPVEQDVKKNIENIFGDFRIDWGEKNQFYTVSGSFVDFIGTINPDKTFIPMVYEFGTLNSQQMFGSLKSLQYTIQENQGTHWGYHSIKDSSEVQKQFRNMFYPDSNGWKSRCVDEFRRVMDKVLIKYSKM